MNEPQKVFDGPAVAGQGTTDAGAATLLGQRPGAEQATVRPARQAPTPDGRGLNQSELTYSDYHYNHHQAYKHLLAAARHLRLARESAVQEFGLVPDWLLDFERPLGRTLEVRPALSAVVD